MHFHELLMEDTLNADAAMLLDYMRERTSFGNIKAITPREALEAIHRPQPEDSIIPQEAAHVQRVMNRVKGILGVAE